VQESKAGGESWHLVQQEPLTSLPFSSMPQRRQQSFSFGSSHPQSLQMLCSPSATCPQTIQVDGRAQRIDWIRS
tara:strand:- start:203 stop:424 length:222 start_codon:yes stop_codon:yes gene_type:complete